MNKIIRLSLANIRKHKTETILTAVLVMFCMLLLGSSVTGGRSIKQLFPAIEERTDTLQNMIYTGEKYCDEDLFAYIMERDDRVERFAMFTILEEANAKILDQDGKELKYPVGLITEDGERHFEIYEPESDLSAEEIAAVNHPIWLPACERSRLKLHEGDDFHLICNAKRFSFTVAGFYDGGYYDSLLAKCIITDSDFALMRNSMSPDVYICYNAKDHADDEAIAEDFEAAFKSATGIEDNVMFCSSYKDNLMNFELRISVILTVMKIMAFIMILAVAVMIRHQIVNTIQEQIVSIGVLEALGYRSHEIALSYAAEYLITAFTGCTVGFIGCFILTPVLVSLGAKMNGFTSVYTFRILPFLLCFAVIMLFVFAAAFLKALSVRKYPPVLAFRKGIQNHHFGKSHFPLRNTKTNVHLRLAMKGFADHMAKNIGMTFVMIITSVCVTISAVLFCYYGRGANVLNSIGGHEMSDLQIGIEACTDADAFEEELKAISSVRRVLRTVPEGTVRVQPVGADDESELCVDAFRDYSETENIFPNEGRFPEHGNEAMLTVDSARHLGVKVGDSISLSYKNVERTYLITGTVYAFYNSAAVYLTEEGLKELEPLAVLNAFNLYLKDGENVDDLMDTLDRKYGKSVTALSEDDVSGGSYEERIRNAAAQQMADMMSQDGASYVSFAIQAGDSFISGDSSAFRINYYSNIREILGTVMNELAVTVSASTLLLTVLSAFIVMMILFILMATELRKQRRELGIMKGIGYTSRELMLQLAFRIMPFVLVAVCIGTAVTVLFFRSGIISMLGAIPVSVTGLIVTDLAMIGFCFGCAYFGARRIKKISVYELMTE